ncbi:unnamed protein product [Caenorhabditis sp. 36 PRJEB53466]|nr:unnamed protein product [Caenorhabditis sp. 36 PRJEB53466]
MSSEISLSFRSITSPECFVGAILIMLIILGCFKIPSMRTPFGYLTLNQCTCQIIACLSVMIFFFVGLVLDYRPILEYSFINGGISLCLLGIIVISYFLMSFNRLSAILFPFQYRYMFSSKPLACMIAASWTVPLAVSLYLLFAKDCGFQFYRYGWTFSTAPKREKCGSSLSLYLVLSQMPFTIATIVCDVITLSFLVFWRARVFKSKSAETKRREMNFARQVLAQGVVFLAHSGWYSKGRNLIPGFSEEWRIFLTTSFSSNLLHLFDAMVVFTCNLEFKDWLIKERKKQTSILVSTIHHLGGSH